MEGDLQGSQRPSQDTLHSGAQGRSGNGSPPRHEVVGQVGRGSEDARRAEEDHRQVTFAQFIGSVQLMYAKARQDDPDHRLGQAFFNYLLAVNQPLADRIRGTEHDPFHHDHIPSEVLVFCSENWDWDKS